MAKNKKRLNLTTKLLLSAVLTYSLITIYNHDSATATNEYDPLTYFEDFAEEAENENTEFIEEYSFEENLASKFKFTLKGEASYYADKFHGRLTANGERFNMNEYSAAHKTMPFGTILKVTNLKNDKKTFVRINDRGPYAGDRILDLSKKSAEDLGGLGLYYVKIEGFKHGSRYFRTSDKDYMFAYSFDNELLTLPSESFNLIDSTNNFGQAVRMYKLAYSNDKNIFLMVKAAEKNRMEMENSDFHYYIGKIRSSVIYDENDIAQK